MKSRLTLGLILKPEFFILEKSVTAITIPLLRGLCRHFQTELIYDQHTFDQVCRKVDFLISQEVHWAAPKLNWRKHGLRRWTQNIPCYIFASDPHDERGRQDYVLDEGIDHVLACYWHPTIAHFPRIPQSRLIHFPWAIPDRWLNSEPISYLGQKSVMIFGASDHEAYSLRNWCKRQPGVTAYPHSGCEGKIVEDEDYPQWLQSFDAVIAAGSDSPRYGLTTPKYFETLSVGSLLFAQETPDTDRLGMRHEDTCILFTRDTFTERLQRYLTEPGNPKWLGIRRNGRELIRERHTISRRIQDLEEHVLNWKQQHGG